MDNSTKDGIALALTGLSFALVITQTNFIDNLLYFMLVGALPHTHTTIHYAVMLAAYLALLAIVVSWLMVRAIRHIRHESFLRKLPRRRYASVS